MPHQSHTNYYPNSFKYRYPDKTFLYEHELMSSSYLHGSGSEGFSSTQAVVWSGIFILMISAATLFLYPSPQPSPSEQSTTIQIVKTAKK